MKNGPDSELILEETVPSPDDEDLDEDSHNQASLLTTLDSISVYDGIPD